MSDHQNKFYNFVLTLTDLTHSILKILSLQEDTQFVNKNTILNIARQISTLKDLIKTSILNCDDLTHTQITILNIFIHSIEFTLFTVQVPST